MSNFSAFFGAQSDDRQALLSPAEAETPILRSCFPPQRTRQTDAAYHHPAKKALFVLDIDHDYLALVPPCSVYHS
jgi:hypothetical protein